MGWFFVYIIDIHFFLAKAKCIETPPVGAKGFHYE